MLEKQIFREVYQDRPRRNALKLSVLRSLYPRLFSDHSAMRIRKIPVSRRLCSLPSKSQLQERYEAIRDKLNITYAKVTERTSAEQIFESKIRLLSKSQLYSSVWIGNKNIDLFLPTVAGYRHARGRRFTGAAIEVDGDVHSLWAKIYKDNDKEELLSWLGITTLRIQNIRVKSKQSLEPYITSFHFRPADTRANRRMWLKIYLVTIFLNASDKEIEALFRCDLFKLAKEFKKASKEKAL